MTCASVLRVGGRRERRQVQPLERRGERGAPACLELREGSVDDAGHLECQLAGVVERVASDLLQPFAQLRERVNDGLLQVLERLWPKGGFSHYFMVGIRKFAPVLAPRGQRDVIVFMRVKKRTPSGPCMK